jgi:hypothetical protein
MRKIDPLEIEPLLYELVIGASASIDLIAFYSFPLFHSVNRFDQESIMALTDERLRFRAIVPRADRLVINQSVAHKMEGRMEVIQDGARTIKIPTFMPTVNMLLVDNREALFADFNTQRKTEDPVYHITNQKNITKLQHLFGSLWSGEPALIYKDIFYNHTRQDVQNIIVSSESYWNDLIRHFANNPSELQKVDDRKFEELIAELLSREGLDVTLTPKSKDGGRDILAYYSTDIAENLYLVECKRYSLNNPVGVKIIRELYGVVEAERATAGLVVTTSRFTKGALKFRETVRHRIKLKEYNQLCDWFKNHAK